MLWKFGWMSNPELWLNEDHSGRERGQSKMMWSSVAGTWHERQTVVAPGRGGRNSLFVPIDQMRETTFVNGKERSTNHVPGHQAGWLMARAPLDLVKASVKSLTVHQANTQTTAGEGSKAQLHLLSKSTKVEQHQPAGGTKRCAIGCRAMDTISWGKWTLNRGQHAQRQATHESLPIW